MKEVRYTLVSEGPSDAALIPLLTGLLYEHLPSYAIQPVWADLRLLPKLPKGLEDRILHSIELYPCDLLFIHRDADRETRAARAGEIAEALEKVALKISPPPAVCVIPIRMTEAWLLFDEAALRRASGNPNGQDPLELPRVRELEGLANPKETLREVLRVASGMSGRRLRGFRVPHDRVAELIVDWTPLRSLSAFQQLEADVRRVIEDQGWT